jgi:uncharacterized membrane protein HdeD (DUF308 family)
MKYMSTIIDSVSEDVRNWWWFLIKGLLFIVAGIAIFYRPAEGYVGLSVLFSVVMLGSGLAQIFFAIANSDILPGWGWTLASGILDLVIGIYLMAYPAVTMVTLPYILGFWLMFAAFYLFGAAIDLSNLGISNWGWLLFGGLVIMVCAFLVLYYPVAGVASIITWSGIAFLAGGVFNLVLAFKLKSVKKTATEIGKKFQHA